MRLDASRCLVMLLSLVLAAALISCGRRDTEEEPEREAAAKPEMLRPEEQTAVIKSGDLELRATVTLPPREVGARVPGVVIVHSFEHLDRDGTFVHKDVTMTPYRDLTRWLAEQGIASVRFDKRTLPQYTRTLNIREFTLEAYYPDALAALELLRSVDCVDPERLYFIGHGEGAVTVPALVEAMPGLGVRGLVLIAPPLMRADDLILRQHEHQIHQLDLFIKHDPNAGEEHTQMRDRLQKGMDAYKAAFDRLREGGAGWEEGLTLNRYPEKFWRHANELYGENLERLKRLTLPILIVQGNLDTLVIAEDLLRYRDELEQTGHIAVVLLDGLDHYLIDPATGHVRPEATLPIATWLRTPPPLTPATEVE